MPTHKYVDIRRRLLPDSNLWPQIDNPLLQKIFAARQVRSAEELDLSLSSLLPAERLLNADKAADLLARTIQSNRKILIIGDFDADGATSTALAMRALTAMGCKKVAYLVPNRFDFGYGLSVGIVDEALKLQPDLIVTVDNGIANMDGVAHAKENDIKVLITDHHLQGLLLPDADVIVNPNQNGDSFPSKALAGVGVIFYVLAALRQRLKQDNWFNEQKIPVPNLADYLDLVALGTVADVVPLDRNNRILVAEGLRRIRHGKCAPGILALLDAAGRNHRNIQASDLGFAVGPRLNAAGRLNDMSIGIECLLADMDTARQLAFELDKLNRERRQIETGMQQSALKILENFHIKTKDLFGLALFDESWHQGVIGILAARIKEKIHRPVIAFATGDETTIKGSARSIPGLHIRDVLEHISSQNPGLIEKFGGHAMAAGLTIASENFDQFQELFNQAVAQTISPEYLEDVIWSDGELEHSDMNLDTARLLQQSGPWGQAFPEPMFDGTFEIINQRILKEKHYKLLLKPMAQTDIMFDAIAFNQVESEAARLPERVKLAYRLDINEFRGQTNLQLMVERIIKVA